MAAVDPHVRGDAGGASADRACSVKQVVLRALVFVIAQLVLNSLLNMPSRRAPYAAG